MLSPILKLDCSLQWHSLFYLAENKGNDFIFTCYQKQVHLFQRTRQELEQSITPTVFTLPFPPPPPPPPPPPVGTPLCGLYRHVRPRRAWFFSGFSHKEDTKFFVWS